MAENKKQNWFKRTVGAVAKYFRELKSDLKKVVWPTPKQVLKNTMIVIACVLVVGAVIALFDKAADIIVVNGILGEKNSLKAWLAGLEWVQKLVG